MSLRVLVAVKRAIDYSVKVRVRADRLGVEAAKMSMNPFDEIAVEEGIRLKDRKVASEVVVVSVGPKKCQETLRTALAMGADRAVHVETAEGGEDALQPLDVAKALQQVATAQQADVVLLGKQAIDDDCNQTGQLLAGLLAWPVATFASRVEHDAAAAALDVTREVDGGLETVRVRTPAVVTCDLRLNEPRFAPLPQIMKARKKPLEASSFEQLGLEPRPRLKTLRVDVPPTRQAGVIVADAGELADKLAAAGFA
mmetsp:Transcript_75073/g.104294  ORF Transcript_75073/g.104294 Transcript_75073/m.104294 type:complete len:255 (+) Transcript_75073:81-845(+)